MIYRMFLALVPLLAVLPLDGAGIANGNFQTNTCSVPSEVISICRAATLVFRAGQLAMVRPIPAPDYRSQQQRFLASASRDFSVDRSRWPKSRFDLADT